MRCGPRAMASRATASAAITPHAARVASGSVSSSWRRGASWRSTRDGLGRAIGPARVLGRSERLGRAGRFDASRLAVLLRGAGRRRRGGLWSRLLAPQQPGGEQDPVSRAPHLQHAQVQVRAEVLGEAALVLEEAAEEPVLLDAAR